MSRQDSPSSNAGHLLHDAGHVAGSDQAVREAAGAMREVVRTYLELPDPAVLRGEPWTTSLRLVARPACSVAEYRRLYAAVGAAYAWHDRDAWTDDQLAARLGDPGVRIWVVEDPATGAAGGYFELEQHDDGAVEIAYFGLVPALHGRRLGAQLLTAAVEAAWAMGATRVWLHTCTLDAPAALPNYLARGFRPVHTERYLAPVGPIGGGG